MRQKIETLKIVEAYRLLSVAKYSALSSEEKIKVWRAAIALMPTAEQYDKAYSSAAEKLRPTTEGFAERLARAEGLERMLRLPNFDPKDIPMGAAEYNNFIVKELNPYNKTVEEAVRPIAEKMVELDIDMIDQDTFGKLMTANEDVWTINQAVKVGQLIVVK